VAGFIARDDANESTMNETLSRLSLDTASQMDSICRERLDAVVRGEFTEDDFISEFESRTDEVPDSLWSLAEWIGRQHHNGQVPDDLLRSLELKIAQRELNTADYGATAELHPRGRRKKRQPPTFIESSTQLRRTVDSGATLRDRYVIENRLGAGGMGTVFKALDKFRGDLAETNRHVAIKILNDDICQRPELFAKLRREFYCAQSLSHRNIVRVYELDRDGDLAFFTMEFLEGELLSKSIARFQPGTASRPYTWRVIREVGAALAHAHARDVVHADLKPHNIMMTYAGDVRLLDFGTSSVNVRAGSVRGTGSAASTGGPTALTPAYASCELLEGQAADPRDDLFAFACLAYELLTGNHPFGQRRSTEARRLGLKAPRPEGLGDGQWKTLELGLSWSRFDRSMAVRDWVAALVTEDPHPETVSDGPVVETQMTVPLPLSLASFLALPSRDLGRMITDQQPEPKGMSARKMALIGALVVAAIIMVVHGRPAFKSAAPTVVRSPVRMLPPARPAAAAAVATLTPAATPNRPVMSIATSSTKPAGTVPAQPAAGPLPAAPTAANSIAAAPPATQPEKPAKPLKPPLADRAANKIDPVPRISIAAGGYSVRPRGHFAEVHVRRSAGKSGDASFVWWTEPLSAHADEDYFSQARTTQTFSAGLRTATLFIRVIPNASHKSPRIFYVVIGDPSGGNALGRITRVPIMLLPHR
jgi:serine/threonine protein kinase